jgi:hypothetical protein
MNAMWQIQVFVRKSPFGKIIGHWYTFETQPTADDLIIGVLGWQAADKFDVYDAALLLDHSTLLTQEMDLMICPKKG